MTDMTVANTIQAQIGRMAFKMMGAKNLVGDTNSLQFKIGRNAKKVTHIVVTLDPSDTYRVEFVHYGRAPKHTRTTIASLDGVFADMLRSIIEGNTGLFLSV